ncbi:hypothetical protein U1Q18_025445 [Sarracenia purpurea var. burkii]
MPSSFSKKESVSSPVAKSGVAAKLQRMNEDKPDPDEDKGAARLLGEGISSPVSDEVKLPGYDFVSCSSIDCGRLDWDSGASSKDRVLPLEGNPGVKKRRNGNRRKTREKRKVVKDPGLTLPAAHHVQAILAAQARGATVTSCAASPLTPSNCSSPSPAVQASLLDQAVEEGGKQII